MAMPNKKAPKSKKADGTPKKRWSSTERAARGHGPRHRGGVDRTGPSAERRSAGYGATSRDDRSSQDDRTPRRDDRFAGRDDRGGFRRDDRPAGRDDRTPRRDDRFAGRDDRTPRRDDRFAPRDDRGGFRRDDRPAGRDDRTPRRDDRFAGRDDRTPRRDDRFAGRDDRTPRRDDRFAGRDDRTPRRDDRIAPRDDRGGFRRDDRPAAREDRGFRRDDRSDNRSSQGREPRHFVASTDRSDRRGPARDFSDRAGRQQSWDRRDDRRSTSDRRPPRDDNFSSPVESDQMSWTESEAVDLEVTAADQASGFAELGVALPMVSVLASKGITAPFPIQSATIADAIAGRDVLGRGRTGSGKTLAFGLSLLTRLSEGSPTGTPRALILTPTRELALQIADVLSPLAAAVRLKLTLIAGGMAYGPQLKAFERGVDIVVATPGRLIDLLEQGAVDLSAVQVTVLDEADHMSDLGFMPAVTTLLDTVPDDGQRLLFSATLDGAVDRLVRKYLHDAVTHEVDSGKASVTTMTHHLLHLAPHHKNAVTAEIANREGKTVVFARTQLGADRIAGQLREAGVLAGALHGGLTQGARARILAAFKNDEVPVLVATDVAARGIHVDDVSLVLQVDPPHGPKDYLHRAGRTARAGESGAVVSLVLPHQRKQVHRLAGDAGVRVEPLAVEPGSEDLRASTGARPIDRAPIADAEYQALIAPKAQTRHRPRHEGGYGGNRGGFSRGGRPRGRG